jgi:hypothetical protein
MKKIFLSLFAVSFCCTLFGQSIYTTYSECPEGAVDLGMVITREDGTWYNVYWGTCNIGATAPEERGGYFAWGETEEKDVYGWDNYAFWDKEKGDVNKYYVDVNNPWGPAIRLDLEDDVAHVRLGGKWRMPTMGEWLALRKECDWEHEILNGVSGFRVTSRTKPENSIFLPICGMRFGDVLYDYGGDPSANYWSSSLCINSSNSAWYYDFSRLLYSKQQGATYRYYGLSVRPVSE